MILCMNIGIFIFTALAVPATHFTPTLNLAIYPKNFQTFSSLPYNFSHEVADPRVDPKGGPDLYSVRTNYDSMFSANASYYLYIALESTVGSVLRLKNKKLTPRADVNQSRLIFSHNPFLWWTGNFTRHHIRTFFGNWDEDLDFVATREGNDEGNDDLRLGDSGEYL